MQGTKITNQTRKRHNIVEGSKFNKLTVINIRKTEKSTHYLCRCDCGNDCCVDRRSLISSHTKSCGCYRLEMVRLAKFRGCGEVTGTYIHNIKQKARERNLPFDVDKEFLSDLFEKQDRKCILSGIDISFRGKTASLDRINSKIGYIKENLQWTHKDINRMKWNCDQDEFIKWCSLVAFPNIEENNLVMGKDVEHAYNWSGIGDLSGKSWTNIKKHAIKRKIHFDICIEQAWDIFLSQNSKCAITGVDIFLSVNYKKINSSASLDRINSDLGYITGNIQWVHKKVNMMKSFFDQQHFIDMCKKVYEKNK